MPHCDAYGNCDSNGHSYCHWKSNGNTDCYSNCHSHGYGVAYCDTDSGPGVRLLPDWSGKLRRANYAPAV